MTRSRKDKTPLLLKIVRWIFPRLEKISPFLAKRYFVKIFFTPLKYRVPEKDREMEQEAQKFEVLLDGKKIQCYSWGDAGPMVLVVHGWAGRASQFRRIIQGFNKAGYRVVGFDGPAHGNSEGRSTNIIEFESVLRKIYEVTGVPEGIVAHSFGGSAVLYSAMNGLEVKRLINIASPTIGDNIIDTYLRTINGTWATGNSFKRFIEKTQGKPFEHFTSLHFIKNLKKPVELLLVHDEDDKDVDIGQAYALKEVYPSATILRTTGLGHTRILKDDHVIEACVTFVKELRLSNDGL